MTPILALYIPKPSELFSSLALLFLAWLLLVAFARQLKIGTLLPATTMLLGFTIAVAPGVYSAYFAEHHDYGYACGHYPGYSESFFDTVAFFHVGQGRTLGVIGMGVGLVVAGTISEVRARRMRRSKMDATVSESNTEGTC